MHLPRTGPRPAASERPHGQALVEFALVVPILFVLLIGIFEAGRYVLYLETLNHATREGARYAIVHGSNSECPSGPPPGGKVNDCDPNGDNVKAAVVDATAGLVASGDLFVYDPVWWFRNDPIPARGDASTGNNFRGNHVTVFVDFSYDPVIGRIHVPLLGHDIVLLPSISISAESSLVVNN